MQVHEVHHALYRGYDALDGCLLGIVLRGGSVHVKALLAVVEEPLIVTALVGDVLRASFLVPCERHTEVGEVIVVVRALNHREVRMELLYVAPRRLVHLARTKGTWAVIYRCRLFLRLGEVHERLCVFRHPRRRASLL